MKDLGAAHFILGMEIKRDQENRKISLNQRKYTNTIICIGLICRNVNWSGFLFL
jgi:hypothetical protein